MADDTLTLFRKLRGSCGVLHFTAPSDVGEIPVPRFKLWRVLIGSFVVYFALEYLCKLLGWALSENMLANIAALLVLSGTCYPLVVWLFKSLFSGRIRTDLFFRFPQGAQYWYALVIFMFLTSPLSFIAPNLGRGLGLWNLAIPFLGGFLVLVVLQILNDRQGAPKPRLGKESNHFGLYLGTSTGAFGNASHGAAVKRGQNVSLPLEDAAQNILILGGIGSGKTTRAVQPLLVQLLDQDCGGLIFDIKGDFKQAASVIAQGAGRELTVIGPEHTKMNLVSGLTPEVAASFLKSALLLNARGLFDPFWIDTATELCKNSLGVLSFFPSRYSLSELHAYLFDPAIRDGVNDEAREKIAALPDRESRLLKTYLSYHEAIFSAFDDKVKSGVNASVAQALSPFNHPDLIDAFCTDDPEAPRMEEVLDGTVFLVDMPLARWGLGGKVAYNFIKLRFFNAMQRRNTEPSWNKDRPVFFMCDEFQEIVSANRDGLSDVNFWDKSRSSKCIGIISAQAVSSFYAAIGHRDLADALLQNFRQKLCFKTEDSHTIEMLNHLLGRVEVTRRSVQEGEGESSQFLSHYTSSSHRSVSTSVIEKNVINPQLFRVMGQNQAVALLSFAGVSADDVLECVPVFAG